MDQLAGALIADLVPSQVVVRQRGVRKELPDGLYSTEIGRNGEP